MAWSPFDMYNGMRYIGAVRRFADKGTSDIFEGLNSKDARRTLPATLHHRARMMLVVLISATTINDLRIPASNRLEKLAGKRTGQRSIRINEQFRICFVWRPEGATEIEITDYH